MNRYIFTVLMLAVLLVKVRADEGMWLPFLVEKYNIGKMTELGLKLTAEEIYSVNQSSLKDAIVMLDYGSCTGEIISNEGLLLTNHHCGYGEIQYHSSVEHDYLTNGFWAMRKEDELPNEGKTASFLIRVEDVTQYVISQLPESMTEEQRMQKIREIGKELSHKAMDGTHYEAEMESMFRNNFFYLFVYETFRDVRLVGAPPESIGKFGADTDNWMWPRHTADFSMFRVYCAKDGKPADYSLENVPYTPKHFLPVSLNGYKNGDYAMILGYPGSTQRYLTSYGVREALEVTNPARIKIRGKKQDIWNEQMEASDKVRIQYSSKFAMSSNYWKYSIGQNKGLKRLKVIDSKKAIEQQFAGWVAADAERNKKYGESLKLIEQAYEFRKNYAFTRTCLYETLIGGTELFAYAASARTLNNDLNTKASPENISKSVSEIRSTMKDFYKDYDAATDQKVMAAMLEIFYKDVAAEFHPSFLADVVKKYKGNFVAYAADVFKKSVFADSTKLSAFLAKPGAKTLGKDPAYIAMESIFKKMKELRDATYQNDLNLARGDRLFQAGLLEMNADKVYAPDANSTMRLTYGTVCDYYPMDAVHYDYYTTTTGVLEKEDPQVREFNVPEKLQKLILNKDFGPYAPDGIMRTCFITNNDITGGNSGSPVINASGELIGAAFDGNWEAMAGDIVFEPSLQRCIVADIRYILFIIDKYAGATNLINEMKLVGGEAR